MCVLRVPLRPFSMSAVVTTPHRAHRRRDGPQFTMRHGPAGRHLEAGRTIGRTLAVALVLDLLLRFFLMSFSSLYIYYAYIS